MSCECAKMIKQGIKVRQKVRIFIFFITELLRHLIHKKYGCQNIFLIKTDKESTKKQLCFEYKSIEKRGCRI